MPNYNEPLAKCVVMNSELPASQFQAESDDTAWEAEMEKLRKLNKKAMVLHFVQGTLQFCLSFTEAYESRVVPITTLYSDWSTGEPVPAFGLYEKYTILRYTSYFALMSALGHFMCLQYWDRYTSDLRKGMNRFRWTEYQFSASLIITLLFMLWNNIDFIQVTGCFVVSAMCI